jgi:hypothetical protein
LAGPASGEQPARGMVGRGVHVAAVVDPLEQEIGDRAGDRGRRFVEPQEDPPAVLDDVVDGEADDAAEGLGVEQDDGGRELGLRRQVAVVQEVAKQADPLVLR